MSIISRLDFSSGRGWIWRNCRHLGVVMGLVGILEFTKEAWMDVSYRLQLMPSCPSASRFERLINNHALEAKVFLQSDHSLTNGWDQLLSSSLKSCTRDSSRYFHKKNRTTTDLWLSNGCLLPLYFRRPTKWVQTSILALRRAFFKVFELRNRSFGYMHLGIISNPMSQVIFWTNALNKPKQCKPGWLGRLHPSRRSPSRWSRKQSEATRFYYLILITIGNERQASTGPRSLCLPSLNLHLLVAGGFDIIQGEHVKSAVRHSTRSWDPSNGVTWTGVPESQSSKQRARAIPSDSVDWIYILLSVDSTWRPDISHSDPR